MRNLVIDFMPQRYLRTLVFVLLPALLSAGAAMPALAFERPFPAKAMRAAMTPAPYPSIIINGKLRSLSAGGKIWSEENLLVMPASLRGNNIVVNYTETAQGDIDRIWILSEEESHQPPPTQVGPELAD